MANSLLSRFLTHGVVLHSITFVIIATPRVSKTVHTSTYAIVCCNRSSSLALSSPRNHGALHKSTIHQLLLTLHRFLYKYNARLQNKHPFNGPFSGTTQVSRYQKGKTNLDFTEANDSEWQWHQRAICKSANCSRQTTTPALHHSVFYRPDALPAAHSTASKH